MPEPRVNYRNRLIEIDAVLQHLRQVKEDTGKMILALQKERLGHKRKRLRQARKKR